MNHETANMAANYTQNSNQASFAEAQFQFINKLEQDAGFYFDLMDFEEKYRDLNY